MRGIRTRGAVVVALGVASCVVCMLVEEGAHADTVRGVRLDRFEPAARGSDFFVLDSLDFRGKVRPAVGLTLDDGYRPLTLVDPTGNVTHAVVNNQAYAHLGLGAALWDRFRIGANVPLQFIANGESGSARGTIYPAPSSDVALGDIRLDVDARLLGVYGEPITCALGASVFLPTGNRDAWAGDGAAAFEPHAMAAGTVGAFVYSARFGIKVRGRDQLVPTTKLSPEITYGLSGGLQVLDRRLTVGPELYGATVVASRVTDAAAPTPAFGLEGLLGAHYAATQSIRVGLGGGVGLGEGFGFPLLRGIASVEWVAPFEEKKPPPPRPPPPKPKPQDRDHDGVDDLNDACPDVPGVAHPDDPLANGCPADRDHDFIPDAVDACPDKRGVKSDDPHKNGCPSDKDGDGIPDEEDACELEPGVKNADPALNGCADNDIDKDGVPNAADACPKDPGPNDADPAKSGCPVVSIEGDWIRTRNPILFVGNTADFDPASNDDATIAAVVKLLNDHPEIRRIRIEAHTDNAKAPDASKKISQARADAVAKKIGALGIPAGRIAATGYGSERPLMPNSTEDGRKLNRRVEIHVEEVSK